MAGILNYDEFCAVVPERTKKFVDEILPYFNYYVDQEHGMSLEGYQADNMARRLIIMLNHKYEQKPANKTQLFLGTEKFTPRPTLKNQDKAVYDVHQVFTNSISTFCFFNFEENYSYLTPERIILNCSREYDKTNSSIIKFLFDGNYDAFRRFVNNYSSYVDAMEKEMKQDMKTEFYGDLSIEVISFLEMVSKVHAYIKNHIKNGNNYNKEVIIGDSDIYTVSVLTALYFVPNTASTIFKANGLDINQFLRYLNLTNLSKNEADKQASNICVLTNYYKKYVYEGKNKGVAAPDITIESIASNLFSRKLNDSIAFEKILANCDSSYAKFRKFETQIEQYRQYEEANRTQEKMKQFYQNLPQKTIEYVELVSKIYTLIVEKMKEGTHNKEVLFNNEDADTLSLLLAMYFTSGKAVDLFNEFGLHYEKVLAFLKVSLTKEEIDKTPVNIDALTNVFQRFIFEGINKGKKSNDITVNHVAKNICDREFNKTLIIERIIGELNKGISVKSNFLPQLEQYLATREEQRKRKLEQKFYGELPATSIKYIKKAEKTFQYLMKSNRAKEFTADDLVELSFLLAYFNNPDSTTYAAFLKNSIAVGNIYSNFNLSENNGAINSTIENIDNIYANFGKYVFGGNNKDKPKQLIKTDDIVKNVFNKELNKSVSLSQLLGDLGSSREKFTNFDQRYEEYQTEQQVKKVAEAKQTIESINCAPTANYLVTVSKIVQTLEELKAAGMCNVGELEKEEDIKEAAILLGLFLEPNDISYFLQKRGITLEKCLEFLNIDMAAFAEYATKQPDYLLIQSGFKNYIGHYWSSASIDDIAKEAFSRQGNLSDVAENIIGFCEQCYKTVSEEVTTKTEIVKPLSKKEELVVFYNEPLSVIDGEDFNTILNVGNSLAKHAKKISDDFADLIKRETQENLKTDEIKGALEVFKTVLPKKKGFFSGKPATREEQDFQIGNNLPQLQKVYDHFIEKGETLAEQITGFDYLIRYMSVFIYHWEEEIRLLETQLEEKTAILQARKNEGTYFDGNNDDIIVKAISSKLSHMQNSKLLWMQEYLKVKSMLMNHVTSLSGVQNVVQTLIPIAYIEKCISEGLIVEKQTLSAIASMVNTLENVMMQNTTGIVETTARLQEDMTPRQIEAISTEIRKGLPLIIIDSEEENDFGEKQKIKYLPTSSKQYN